jgi:phospholipid/cholesterol/gamma-HCH transport system permease protein
MTAADEPIATLDSAEAGAAVLRLAGVWQLQRVLPDVRAIESALQRVRPTHLRFDTTALAQWDSGLLVFLARIKIFCREQAITCDDETLPPGVRRLFALAAAQPAQTTPGSRPGWLARLGERTQTFFASAPEVIRFTGELAQALGRFLRGRARYRSEDLWLIVQASGPTALPIVSLISFLVGLILAYMGAVQLARLGAEIYIADLVGIGMVREIAALMTGIILAGRTGAAFAAQLGTMQVNEEIDALRALGLPPMEFLVLPRVLALLMMMPLLTLYASVVGILAGLTIALLVFDVGAFEYYHHTLQLLDLRHFAVGLSKGTVYGLLVAYAGCLRGMQCGRSAQAVGEAATSAVVTGILLIVIFASIMTILFQRFEI